MDESHDQNQSKLNPDAVATSILGGMKTTSRVISTVLLGTFTAVKDGVKEARENLGIAKDA